MLPKPTPFIFVEGVFICLKNDDGLVYKGILTFLVFSKVLKFCGALKQINGKK